jgi:hypothetical protein
VQYHLRCEIEDKLLSFLNIKRMPNPHFLPYNGIFKNKTYDFVIKIDNLSIFDPNGNTRKLIPKSNNEFYVERLPVIIRFISSELIIMAGMQIIEKWTEIGLEYKKLIFWIKLCTPQLRITNGNCSPPVRRFGLRKTPVGLTPFVVFCLRHIWGRGHLLRKVL